MTRMSLTVELVSYPKADEQHKAYDGEDEEDERGNDVIFVSAYLIRTDDKRDEKIMTLATIT